MRSILVLCVLLAPAVVHAQTLYTIRQTVCVSAAEQKAFNTALEVAGYGPGSLFKCAPSKLDISPTPTCVEYCVNWRMTLNDDAKIQSEATKGGFTSVTLTPRDTPENATGVPSFADALDARGLKPPAKTGPSGAVVP